MTLNTQPISGVSRCSFSLLAEGILSFGALGVLPGYLTSEKAPFLWGWAARTRKWVRGPCGGSWFIAECGIRTGNALPGQLCRG